MAQHHAWHCQVIKQMSSMLCGGWWSVCLQCKYADFSCWHFMLSLLLWLLKSRIQKIKKKNSNNFASDSSYKTDMTRLLIRLFFPHFVLQEVLFPHRNVCNHAPISSLLVTPVSIPLVAVWLVWRPPWSFSTSVKVRRCEWITSVCAQGRGSTKSLLWGARWPQYSFLTTNQQW